MHCLQRWKLLPSGRKHLKPKKPWKPPKARHGKSFLRNFRTLTRANLKHKCISKMKKVTGEIYFKKGQGFFTSVFGSDSKYWSPADLGKPTTFPTQLTPIGGSSLPIPAVSFDSTAPSLKKIFNNWIDIYATPDQYFTTKFREIFQKTRLTHHSRKE